MLLVLQNEVDPDKRYFVEAMRDHLPEHEVYDYATEGGQPSLDGVDGVVVSGSTAGVYERESYQWMDEQATLVRELVEREVPTLGVCFGHQLINHALGGGVEHHGMTAELVRADLADDPLFEGVGPVIPAVHGDRVVERGERMDVIGSTDDYEHFATRHASAPVWTVQYHPEFTRALLPRIATDFGWRETDHSFADATAERTFRNFAELAGVD